jgi:uncharacterized RDD family membrane protein YckC
MGRQSTFAMVPGDSAVPGEGFAGEPAGTFVPAELAPRVAARAIDVAVLVVVEVGLGRVMGFGFDWLALGTALVLVYFAGLDALFGATLGKAALGLRVLGPDGGTPTLRQALVREAFTVVGSVPFIGGPLSLGAWIWIGRSIRRSESRQGKHDRLAGGTRVVRVGAR